MYIKKIILVLIIASMLLLLTGCGYGELIGQVVNKRYTPSRVIPQVIYTGKTAMTIPVTYPEEWKIEIQKEEQGELKTTWISVSEQEYNNIQVGDNYGF